jgi:DNA mismatch endonuclease (patch repair protein)
MTWLLENNAYDLPNLLRPECHHGVHSYASMYGRLRWDAPAQTITTGFGSMGQGRFVHPSRPRTLTPHEAARLQTLPDFFDLDETKGRGAWAAVIGNAVPPLLGAHIASPLLCALGVRSGSADDLSTSTSVSKRGGRRNSTPPASSEHIRTRMRATKRRDTDPELALRSELHRLGHRFRVDYNIDGTRRRADIVFRREHLAVFVDGCFWHACPKHGTVPKQNRDWWTAKLEANRRRDCATDEALRSLGWQVIRCWEHDDPVSSAERISGALASRRDEVPRR